MSYKAGQIVEIPVPYTDGRGAKRRPVVIVAEADSKADMIGLPITGSDHHPHTLPLADADIALGGMKKASFIRVRKPVAFNAVVVGRSFGQLTPKALARVHAEMCSVFGCSK